MLWEICTHSDSGICLFGTTILSALVCLFCNYFCDVKQGKPYIHPHSITFLSLFIPPPISPSHLQLAPAKSVHKPPILLIPLSSHFIPYCWLDTTPSRWPLGKRYTSAPRSAQSPPSSLSHRGRWPRARARRTWARASRA